LEFEGQLEETRCPAAMPTTTRQFLFLAYRGQFFQRRGSSLLAGFGPIDRLVGQWYQHF
jgi:hypothetical protein